MTQPLALVLYEKLLPGTQLVNRLQDLGYRVQALTNARALVAAAEQAGPIVVLADLESNHASVCEAIADLKKNSATAHLPVITFSGDNAGLLAAAREAGATLAVSDTAILAHLPELLDQGLQIE